MATTFSRILPRFSVKGRPGAANPESVRKNTGIGFEQIADECFKNVSCLDVVPFEDIPVENGFKIALQKLAPLHLGPGHGDLGEPPVSDIVIKRRHDTAASSRMNRGRRDRDLSVSKIFPKRKRQHEDVLVPAAKLGCDLAAEQLRVASRASGRYTVCCCSKGGILSDRRR